MDINADLIAALVPGATLRLDRGPGASSNELRHIRAIVDDEYVVYKVWWPGHKRWEYQIAWVYAFHLEWEEGCLTVA